MIVYLILWLLAILYVESLTEIIISSSIAQKFKEPLYNFHLWCMSGNWLLRNTLGRLTGFVHELTSCGQCTSVWVAATVAWALPGVLIVGAPFFDFVVKIFIIQRLSNVLHELFSRWFKRVPLTVSLHTTVTNYKVDGLADGHEQE